MGILDGRVALVTGAGQGIGAGIARALGGEGARVAAVGRTLSKVEATAAEVEAAGGNALAVQADVGDAGDIDAAVDAVVAWGGSVDILVHAAHHPVRAGTVLDMDENDVQAQWDTGPLAALRLMRRCHPFLKGGGAVVNIGSGAQLTPERYGLYAAAKDAIRSISRAAAIEWGPDGIRVNVVAPFAHSPAMDAALPDADADAAVLRRIPLRRVGDPEHDIGRVVVFLVGPDSAYLTGEMLVVDGGMTYHR